MAVLGIAVENYQEALGCLLGLQETACQYGDDNILLSAVKTTFGVATLLISMKSQADSLWHLAFFCWKMLLGKDEECAHIHSEKVRRLGAGFYSILQDFAMMHDPRASTGGIGMLHVKLVSEAEDIDKATMKRFRMREWVNETVRRLGYSTGVK
jgi:hypothetical protein